MGRIMAGAIANDVAVSFTFVGRTGKGLKRDCPNIMQAIRKAGLESGFFDKEVQEKGARWMAGAGDRDGGRKNRELIKKGKPKRQRYRKK